MVKSKSKRIAVSIAVPAYNEEKFIKMTLDGVLNQKETDWYLAELIVISDGSTDKTSKVVRSIRSSKIKFFDEKERKGKTFRWQQMINRFKGEILVFLDSDIYLKGTSIISDLIKPIRENTQVALVGGNSRPYQPQTFFQRCVYRTFEVFDESRKVYKNGNNIFGCTGSILAMSREYAKSIKLPGIINEDAFLYFDCLSKGYKFRYVDSAIIHYKSPTNVKDYLKQVFRSEPSAVRIELRRYFGSMVDRELTRPRVSYLTSIAKVLLRHPVETLVIIVINLICKPLYPLISSRYKLSWFTAESSHR